MEELGDLLLSLNDTPAKFADKGLIHLPPLPGLHIDGVGPVSLPLCGDGQKQKIKTVATLCEQPDGESNVWMLPAEKVSIRNDVFQKKVKEVTTQMKNSLGLSNSENVRTHFAKLVLCEEGGILSKAFLFDRDKENETTFAILQVQLPSIFQGSDLVLQHSSKKAQIKFDGERSPYEIAYAAHYLECEYEALAVESGCRLVLIYDFVWTGSSPAPSLNIDKKLEDEKRVVSLLQQIHDADKKELFGWALENEYDKSLLVTGVSALKGEDRLVANALNVANKKLDKYKRYAFYIVEIERKTTERGGYGQRRHNSYYNRRKYCGSDDEDEREDSGSESEWFDGCEEISEDTTSFPYCFSFKGKKCELKKLSIDVENDLINIDSDADFFFGDCYREELDKPTHCCSYGCPGGEDCDDCTAAERTRWYRKYLILCILPNHKFKLRCKNNGFKWSLELLSKQFACNPVPPTFGNNFEVFLNEFEPQHFDQESLTCVIDMLAKSASVELVQLFITEVLQKKVSTSFYSKDNGLTFGLKYPETAENISSLLLSVPWESIKPQIECLIPQCQVEQYQVWLHVAKLSGITEISHQVAETTFKRISEKVWTMQADNEQHLLHLFQILLTVEELFVSWWEKLTSLVEVTENVKLLAILLSRLEGDLHEQGHMFLFDCFINAVDSVSEEDVDSYSQHAFKVFERIIEVDKFQKKMKELSEKCIQTGNMVIIGRLIEHLYNLKPDLVQCCNFEMLLSDYAQWLSRATLNVSHCAEIAAVAKVLISNRNTYKDLSERYIENCVKIQDFDLMCNLTQQMSDLRETNAECNTDIIKSFLNAILLLLEQRNTPCGVVISPIIQMMFRDDEHNEILHKFLRTNAITQDINLLQDILSSLCCKQNEASFLTLKENINFRTILLNLICLYSDERSVPDRGTYANLLVFLFTDEKWCMEVSDDLLSALINASCVKNDFCCLAGAVSKMPYYSTANYKLLVASTVAALNVCLDKQEVPAVEYTAIKEFVKMLISKLASLDEIYIQFLHLPHLESNDDLNMYTSTSSVLVKLITDLKSEFQNSKQYAGLLSLRLENLSRVISKGKPVMNLQQSHAELPELPDVERFLKSYQKSFQKKGFSSIIDARNWASKYFPNSSGWSGGSSNQEKKGYRCSVSSGGSGRNSYVEIRKEPFDSEKERMKKFEQFGAERRQHKATLKKVFGSDSNVFPAKKPLQESNFIDLSSSNTSNSKKKASEKIVIDDDDDYDAGDTNIYTMYHKRPAGRTPRAAAGKKKKYTHDSDEEDDPDYVP